MLKRKLSKKAEFTISSKSGDYQIFLLVTATSATWILVNRNLEVLATTKNVKKTTAWRAN
ncbi:MAG: hypothetical protein WBI40_09455 [Methylococcaceae bacterium]